MNLDLLINEAGNVWTNHFNNINKKTEDKPQEKELTKEQKQQLIGKKLQDAMPELDKLYAEFYAAEKAGDKEKMAEAKKKIREVNGKLADPERQKEDSKAIRTINNKKAALFFDLVNYLKLTSGIGIDDNSSGKKQIRVIKDENGEKKVVGTPPTKQELNAHYNKLKADAQQLLNYEESDDTPTRYFIEMKAAAGVALVQAVEKCDPSKVSFDIKTRGIPKGPRGQDRSGKPVVGTIGAENLERWNPKIFAELYPFVEEFSRFRKDYKEVVGDLFIDLYNKDDPENRDERRQRAIDSVTPKHNPELEELLDDFEAAYEDKNERLMARLRNEIEKFDDLSEFKKHRAYEILSHKRSELKNTTRGEDGKQDRLARNNADYGIKSQMRKAEAEGTGKTANQLWLEKHHIGALNFTKVKKMLQAYIDEDKKNGAQPKKIIKLFGKMPDGSNGTSGNGVLVLINADDVKKFGIPTIPNQFQFEGMYGFKGSTDFKTKTTTEMDAYVDVFSRTDPRKAKVKAAVDAEVNKSSVMTESANYFNY